jgi:integrase
MLGSGIRLGEAIGLDQGDLMLDEGYIRLRVSKTHVRALRIGADAVTALRQALAVAPRRGVNEPVFFAPGKPRERMRGTSVSHVLPRLLTAAGLPPLSPHKLRHAAATIMVADGVPMRVVADQLGHRNPAVTARIYAHVAPEQLVDAVRSLERRSAR